MVAYLFRVSYIVQLIKPLTSCETTSFAIANASASNTCIVFYQYEFDALTPSAKNAGSSFQFFINPDLNFSLDYVIKGTPPRGWECNLSEKAGKYPDVNPFSFH
ncbi:hypothetical protein OUZ56_001840 [Daphnia magna]|uniref:Uncharacterized protein n=1 Tax=Daphnia magna TaxID=35525 RepID=A0ABR0A3V9_9CRUS|nr:hypothetical protein OUZ56_001840 [Daphnia magna]